ncbi:MAG TPA: enolase C-terminal domain-like protein [Blastocatellia bacterium]|nr:enolase C-terminal domain-like protein [Blastocatellia bacterium]
MRVVGIREQTISISRYSDHRIPSDGLNTTAVAVVTDVHRNGAPVIGFGFSSIGRFGQSGLIRERFAPRLIAAREDELVSKSGDNFDPFRAWDCMMKGEKPGGHGERCVAVGTLDMALWDAAAKIAEKPLFRFLGELVGKPAARKAVPVYAGGGYYFPSDDIPRLTDEIRQFLDQGYTHVKIKIGGLSLDADLKRIEAVLSLLPGADHLAVDAMNRYTSESAICAAQALAPYRLRWFEDMCDPLDFETHAQIARTYDPPLAVGEALFSLADARNLLRYGGLRSDRDVFLFDPAHCYGLPEYLKILETLKSNGWSLKSCQPHGGHLFSLHVAAALGLGGSESNPHNFQPFGGFADGAKVENGSVRLPEAPGIGFETRSSLYNVFRSLSGNGEMVR